jgi:hypothetical protein
MVLPLVLLGLGIFLILKSKDDAGWIGVALIGLALFLRLLEGQRISSLGLGPDGISISLLAQKIDEVEKKADAAAASNGKPFEGDATKQSEENDKSGAWSVPEERIKSEAPGDDQQKNQWGQAAQRNGRVLLGFVDESSNDPDLFWVRLVVKPIDGAPPIQTPVRFHLHETFPKQKVQIRSRQGEAHLERYAYGAFTVGAEIMNEPETYLELDLAELSTAPESFRKR